MKTTKIEFARLPKDYAGLCRMLLPRPIHDKVDFENLTEITDAMAGLIGHQPFHALTVDAVRHDCGDKAGFVLANLALALDRPDLAPQVEAFLASR